MDLVHDRGPWTRSMKVVHGPGPKRGSMDPWSMFCPHPLLRTSAKKQSTCFGSNRLGFMLFQRRHFWCKRIRVLFIARNHWGFRTDSGPIAEVVASLAWLARFFDRRKLVPCKTSRRECVKIC